jgi:uncharacterized DUF497 family protein
MTMFIWDAENLSHIARHRISQEESEQVIQNHPLDLERQIVDGEERFLHLGETLAKRILFVVVTERDDLLRVVTAFPADRKARRFYSLNKDAAYAKGDQYS